MSISVWVLLITIYGYREPSLTVIDNIANQDECLRVQRVVQEDRRVHSTRCIEVRKLK